MLKHTYREFPSDLFLILETVGAQVTIASGPTVTDTQEYSIEGFLAQDMNKRVILAITLPARDSEVFVLRTYKVRGFNYSMGNLLHYNYFPYPDNKACSECTRVCECGISS